jgi:flagellar biosynthesis component FlhA
MLRNPINRAYSAYQHVSRGLTEQLTFEKALQIEEERLDKDKFLTPMVMYKDMGMYYKMVKAYLESFDNVHIILYKDFSNDTEEEIKKVFCFLGVNESKKVDFTTRYNVGGRRWKNRIIKKIFTKEYKLKLALKSKLPRQLRKEIRGKLVRPFTKNVLPMKKKTRGYLKEYFREDVKRLTILINKNLTNWIK